MSTVVVIPAGTSYSDWLRQQTAVSSTSFDNKAAALELAKQQIRVFPCKDNKTPAVKEDWEGNATCDLAQVERMWGAANHVPALPCGAQGLVVIDCDRKPGGEDGVAAFHSLSREHGIDLSGSFTVQTPSGGAHVYFTSREPLRNSVGKLAKGVDVRASGGYVIAPGATLPDGRGYRIIAGNWKTIPALPEALAAMMRSQPPESLPTAPTPVSATGIPGERDLATGRVALAEECAALRALKAGDGRNNRLNIAAHSLGTLIGNGSLQRDAIEQALMDASKDNGHVHKHGIAQTLATITSGIEAGISKPRPPLPVAINMPAPVATASRTAVLIRGSDIKVKPIQWLWKNYLPLGMLTILSGVGGSGKSSIASSFAATITTAAKWPDGTKFPNASKVLFWGSEEGKGDMIAARMIAACGDPDRYFIVAGTKDEAGKQLPFDPARDMDTLCRTVHQMGSVSLLVLDPIVNAIQGDSNKAVDVRKSLQPILDFAAEQNCAVLGITHFGKGTAGKRPDERVLASSAFKDVPRMVFAVEQAEGSNDGVFTRSKSNISPKGGGYRYVLREEVVVTQYGERETTSVTWGDELDGSARSILAEVEEETADTESAIGKAKEWLKCELAIGPKFALDVQEAAKQVGIASATLRRAREALKIRITKDMENNGKSRWSLPGLVFDQLALDNMPSGRRTQVAQSPPWNPVGHEQVV